MEKVKNNIMKNFTFDIFVIALIGFALGLIVMYSVQQQYVKSAQNNTKTLLSITKKMENEDDNLISEDDQVIQYLASEETDEKDFDIDKAAVMGYHHHIDRLNLINDRELMDNELTRIEKNN